MSFPHCTHAKWGAGCHVGDEGAQVHTSGHRCTLAMGSALPSHRVCLVACVSIDLMAVNTE